MSIQLQVETTTACNKGCHFCPLPDIKPTRDHGTMSMDLFRKIVDEASGIGDIEQLCLTGLGETMLDRWVIERAKYARDKMPSSFIDIYTNGSYLTPEKFDALKAVGISCVTVSLNAIDADQHHKIMGGRKDFDTVMANTEYAVAHRGGVMVQVKAVVNGDTFTEADGWKFYAKWGHRDLGGYGQLVYEGNWAGSNRTTRAFKPNECCSRALTQIYVLFDGRVTPCCLDPDGRHKVFGNLSKQTIKQVYNSPDYLAFREAHDANRADEYSFCKVCSRI